MESRTLPVFVCIYAFECTHSHICVHKIKNQTESTAMECAEIKGIKSHGAPEAVREERVILKVTAAACSFPLPDTLNLPR